MLRANTLFTQTDPETQRKNALVKVYALLIRIVDDENKTARPENFAEDTEQAVLQQQDPIGKESHHAGL